MSFPSHVVAQFAAWREDPALMVRQLFDVEPDPWQEQALRAFPKSPRLAMKSCKGPGKSTVLAWIAWNFLLTRLRPKVAATSVSAENLADCLWTEMAKWQSRSPLLQKTFTWQKTRIFANDCPEEWWMSARTWSKSADAQQQADTLAGLHAAYVLFLIDEVGGCPDALLPTAEAALAGDPEEAHIVIAGNPTHLSGPLYRAATLARKLWTLIEITGDPDDPNRSPRIAIEYAREQIEQYGRDNPWVLVNIFGQFPPSSLNALIGPDEVSASFKRMHQDFQHHARVIGVDVALFGDDSSVIFKRQGPQAFRPIRLRNVAPNQGAGRVAREWADWNADAVFVDDTGGFGSGWIDSLRLLGRAPIGVHFASEAHHKAKYFNKRAEMYFELVEWIKRGGALPDEPELLAALTQTTYSFKGDKMLLEPKDSVKTKLGYSPDIADAAALTFAEPVTPRAQSRFAPKRETEFNPYREQPR